MTMADPFLPEGVPPVDDTGDGQPEDFEHDLEGEPDVLAERPEEDEATTSDGEPPVSSSVFKTPTGDSVDPARDS
jgi:hypothetical protein